MKKRVSCRKYNVISYTIGYIEEVGITITKINGREIEVPKGRKINIEVVEELILEIIENNVEQWFEEEAESTRPSFLTIITTSKLQAYLYKKYDMDLSTETFRRNGFCPNGVLEEMYDFLGYNDQGNSRKWGMVVDYEEYLREKGRLEEMKNKYEEKEENTNVPEGHKGVEGVDY